MSAEKEPSLQEVAVLTRSIEFVVRNFVRILVGKISLVRLQELLQTIFIQEAENYLKRERPDKSVSLTALAVLTGADTRKLTQVRSSDSYRRPLHLEQGFLGEMTPESCVIGLWTSNHRFLDKSTGEPRVLNLWGKRSSFETLVREAIRTRGVTVQSIAARMERNNLLDISDDNKVTLKITTFAPLELRQKISDIKLGLDAAGHLLGTVNHNLSTDDPARRYFQRGSWTHRLQADKCPEIEQDIASHLATCDDEVRTILERYEENGADDEHLTAGVGLFYFETKSF